MHADLHDDKAWTRDLGPALREAAVSGTLAAVLSAVALAWAGRREARTEAAPINAVSHWWWGDRALQRDEVSARHTLLGYATHHVAASFWAVLHAWLWGRRPQAAEPVPAAAAAVATAATAALVDFKFTPHRFTPGYEHRVSPRALVGVYACFAVGLAAGSLLMHRRR